jgi:hypothetical protein
MVVERGWKKVVKRMRDGQTNVGKKTGEASRV